MNGLDVNTIFDNYEDLRRAIKEYECTSNTLLVIDDCCKLKGAGEFVVSMVYSRLQLKCKAGTERPSQSRGIRETSTFKKNCPVKIKIKLKDDKLVVTACILQHENHGTDAQTFNHYPENLRLTADEIKEAQTMIAADGNKKKMKKILMDKRGSKPFKLKTLHNIHNKIRIAKEQPTDENELQILLNTMIRDQDAKVRVVKDENDELLSVYYQNARMGALFDKYPEVLLYDATHGLNNRRMPLFLQLIIDGNGQTEIVSIWFCKSESRVVIDSMLDSFKELNPSWTKVRCIIADKDFVDRDVYKQKFPAAALQICLFHVLRTFYREISTSKREITKGEREIALELLQNLCYSRTEEAYDTTYQQLIELDLEKVTEYFNTNWHPIREEWTLFGKNKYSNYLNYTNNRTESLNGQLKTVGNRYSNLLTFFDNVSTSVAVIASEKDIKAIQGNMRVTRKKFDNEALSNYHQLLTPFTFSKLLEQFKHYDKVIFDSVNANEGTTNYGRIVTLENCGCEFFKAMSLPCRHIFQLCHSNNLDLYLPSLCAARWTKEYYKKSHPALQSIPLVSAAPPLYVQKVRERDEIDKFKSASKVTKEINSMASSLPPDKFAYFMEKLEQVKNEIVGIPQQPATSANNDQIPGPPNRTYMEVVSQNGQIIPNENLRPRIVVPSTSNMSGAQANFMGETIHCDMVTSQTTSISVNASTSQLSQSDVINQAGPSSSSASQLLLITTDIKNTKLPPKNVPYGRPKQPRTVIGTKRKSSNNLSTGNMKSGKSFNSHSKDIQGRMILHWLTNNNIATFSAQKLAKKVTYSDIIQDEYMFQRLSDENIDISTTKKFCDKRCYMYLQKEAQNQLAKTIKCRFCEQYIRNNAIICQGCLDSYHEHCSDQTKKPPPKNKYFCKECLRI